MTEFYTYLHCKPNGDPFYIGKGSRSRSHGKRSHDLKSGRNPFYLRIVNKYGAENIGVFVFPCESEQQAFVDEIQQIAQLRSEGFLLANLSDGGEGTSGIIPSLETRAKISKIHKGKKLSEEHKKKISAAHTGKKKPPFSKEWRDKIAAAGIGRKVSAETRAKRSASMMGRKCSSEHIENNRIAQLGKKLTAEHKAKTSATLKGRIFSEEHRKKISAALQGRKLSPEHRIKAASARKGKTPWNKGIHMKQEQKNKLSETKKLLFLNRKMELAAGCACCATPEQQEAFDNYESALAAVRG